MTETFSTDCWFSADCWFSLEGRINIVCDWLMANKLTVNTRKSYFVIFWPRQKKLEHKVNLNVIDNNTNTLTSLECKEYVKYLGILIDGRLSWKFHIDYYVASKLSKIVGIIARLRQFVPLNTLLSIYQLVMFTYLTFGSNYRIQGHFWRYILESDRPLGSGFSALRTW